MQKFKELTYSNRGGGFVAFLIILAILAGGGYYAYTHYLEKKGPGSDFRKDFQYVTLKEEILLLTYYKLPKIYQSLTDFENEVTLINKEIDRLNDMEKEFPQQLNIISEEKNVWTQARAELTNTFSQIESELEAIYVSYRVNTAKGSERIEEKKEELLSLASEKIKISKELTDRLKKTTEKKKKFIFF